MNFLDEQISRLDGTRTTLGQIMDGNCALVVNVASECSFTPQYRAMEALYERYGSRGLTVIGVPCNQFDAQEPGTSEEIATFCSTTYGVTFPMTTKVDVNGPNRHPIYRTLTQAPDQRGVDGDVEWNFEKFLIDPEGNVIGRFRDEVEPDAAEVVELIEALTRK